MYYNKYYSDNRIKEISKDIENGFLNFEQFKMDEGETVGKEFDQFLIDYWNNHFECYSNVECELKKITCLDELDNQGGKSYDYWIEYLLTEEKLISEFDEILAEVWTEALKQILDKENDTFWDMARKENINYFNDYYDKMLGYFSDKYKIDFDSEISDKVFFDYCSYIWDKITK